LSCWWDGVRFPCRNEDLLSDPWIFAFCGTQRRVQNSVAPRRSSSTTRTARAGWQPSILPPQTGANKITRLEAIVQPSRLGAVKAALAELGIGGMAVSGVRGHGSHQGQTEVYRGRKYIVELLPKIKLEMLLPDDLVDSALDAIRRAASTSRIGEDSIFVSRLEQSVRLQNRERGPLIP
jgi:nitrogen regulatory protein P-II 1